MLSDTHAKHAEIEVPDGDVLIHAGDFTMAGEEESVVSFNLWLGMLPHRHKLVIAGNHDLGFERAAKYNESLLTNCTYLRDEGIEIGGKLFWASPYTPFFMNEFWVFHKRGYEAMREHWKQIPEKVDVLITHGPPNRILDETRQGEYAGDLALLERCHEVRPKVHVFGHIHEGSGQRREAYGAQVFNASVLDRTYRVHAQPFVFDLS